MEELIFNLRNITNEDAKLRAEAETYINTHKQDTPVEFFILLFQCAQQNINDIAGMQALIIVSSYLTPQQFYTPQKIRFFWENLTPEARAELTSFIIEISYSNDVKISNSALKILNSLQKLQPTTSNGVFSAIKAQLENGNVKDSLIIIQSFCSNNNIVPSTDSADIYNLLCQKTSEIDPSNEIFIYLYPALQSMLPIFGNEEGFISQMEVFLYQVVFLRIHDLATNMDAKCLHLLFDIIFQIFLILYDHDNRNQILMSENFVNFLLSCFDPVNGRQINLEVLNLFIRISNKEIEAKNSVLVKKSVEAAAEILFSDSPKLSNYTPQINTMPYREYLSVMSDQILQAIKTILFDFGSEDLQDLSVLHYYDKDSLPPHMEVIILANNLAAICVQSDKFFKDILQELNNLGEQSPQSAMIHLEVLNALFACDNNDNHLFTQENEFIADCIKSEADSISEMAMLLIIGADDRYFFKDLFPSSDQYKVKIEETIFYRYHQALMSVISSNRDIQLVKYACETYLKLIDTNYQRYVQYKNTIGFIFDKTIPIIEKFTNFLLENYKGDTFIFQKCYEMYGHIIKNFDRNLYNVYGKYCKEKMEDTIEKLHKTYLISETVSSIESSQAREVFLMFINYAATNNDSRWFDIANDFLPLVIKLYEETKDSDVIQCIFNIYNILGPVNQEQYNSMIEDFCLEFLGSQNVEQTILGCTFVMSLYTKSYDKIVKHNTDPISMFNSVFSILNNNWILEQILPAVLEALTTILRSGFCFKSYFDSKIELAADNIDDFEIMTDEQVKKPGKYRQAEKSDSKLVKLVGKDVSEVSKASLNEICTQQQELVGDFGTYPEEVQAIISELIDIIANRFNFVYDAEDPENSCENVLIKAFEFLKTVVLRIGTSQFILDHRINILKIVRIISDNEIQNPVVLEKYMAFYDAMANVFFSTEINMFTRPFFVRKEFVFPIVIAQAVLFSQNGLYNPKYLAEYITGKRNEYSQKVNSR